MWIYLVKLIFVFTKEIVNGKRKAQFLLTEFLGLPTLGSNISEISLTILQILVPILLQIS